MGNNPSSFDQSFTTYLRDNKIPTRNFTPTSQANCSLLKRDINFRSNIPHQKNTNNEEEEGLKIVRNLLHYVDGVRTYFIHIPPSIRNFANLPPNLSLVHCPNHISSEFSLLEPDQKIPLIICLHGTDETAFDCELLKQVDEKMSWLEISDTKNCVIVFPQSRGQWATDSLLDSSWREKGDFFRSLWVLGFADENKTDIQYLQQVVDDVCNWINCIDKTKIYIIGFSNGGFMAADCLLHLDKFTFTPAAVCCYMGGVEDMQLSEIGLTLASLPPAPNIALQYENDDPKVPALYMPAHSSPQPLPLESLSPACRAIASRPNKPSVLMMTGDLDMQLSSCLKGWEIFSYLGFLSHLYVIKNAEHEYHSASTSLVWDFFENSRTAEYEIPQP